MTSNSSSARSHTPPFDLPSWVAGFPAGVIALVDGSNLIGGMSSGRTQADIAAGWSYTRSICDAHGATPIILGKLDKYKKFCDRTGHVGTTLPYMFAQVDHNSLVKQTDDALLLQLCSLFRRAGHNVLVFSHDTFRSFGGSATHLPHDVSPAPFNVLMANGTHRCKVNARDVHDGLTGIHERRISRFAIPRTASACHALMPARACHALMPARAVVAVGGAGAHPAPASSSASAASASAASASAASASADPSAAVVAALIAAISAASTSSAASTCSAAVSAAVSSASTSSAAVSASSAGFYRCPRCKIQVGDSCSKCPKCGTAKP